MPVWVLVTGITVINMQLECHHLFETIKTTLPEVDIKLYNNMVKKYGDKYHPENRAEHFIRLLVFYRDIIPDGLV